ncbi:hypothetical protein F5B22DRAFT_612822 [Xylaria bambusicola]|uniref:uncharacterized protein n=1 Tax=Xylaria bambusicola TaxID=326684 RepID=UPI002007C558|nr:uncharacterized protein F5B22DRAFT_612822 [Xylaria bambusicola]KAI0512958.1 hypothetical protein F5B22DRAFT_612822 [Xylaria bambusicola]
MASLLPRAAPLRRSIATSQCTKPFITTRLLSSTPSAQSQKIPPESPQFINVPNPPQDQSIEAKRELKPLRGFVPVPRRIFAHRDSHQKPTDDWLERSAPVPTNAKSQAEPASELQAWKRKMATSRRENMRSGVRDLWSRKQRIDAKRIAARTAKLEANKAAMLAPEREDERLTRGSVNPGTLQTAVAPDPERFQRALASAARTASIAADKSELRRDAIQTLYMNARSFIVSESELEAAVNIEFADDHFERLGQSGAGYRIQNIWNAENEPMSVASMLRDLQRSNDTLVADFTSEKTRTDRRQKRVAEELAGGKMD